ncbi:hypothetical protein DFS34DRAFT_641038 [Phlyctochytrium arcticum]|nr:hypothetical protein DFS34DRAFT_641038 [Phlyctochytrium arcticum]
MSIIPSVTDLPRTIVFLNKPRSDSGVQDLEFDVATTPPTSPAIPPPCMTATTYLMHQTGKPDIVDAEVVRDSAVSLTEFVPVVVAPSQVLSAPSTSIIGPVTTGDSLIVDIPPSALDLTSTRPRREVATFPATIGTSSTTDDSDESIEPDVVVPLSIEAVLAAIAPPRSYISVTRANLTGLKSSLARHTPNPRRSSKSVRFNHLQFQEVCVFRRGIKAQDIPTCPRFIQSIHDMEAAEREEREAYEALTPASVPAVTLRPSNFSYNELSRLDPSCPLRVEKVVMNSRDPVPAPTILVQVRVANWGTPKQLTIRYSLDDWATFAETTESDCRWGGFVEGTECGEERFGVELRGQGRAGSSIKFAVRYSVNDCVFWDSNAGRDYQVSVSKPAPLTTTTRTRLPPPCSGSIDGFLIDPIIPDSPPRPRRQRSQSTLPPLKRTDTDPLPLRSPFSARYSFGEGRRGVRLDGRRGGLFGSEDC